MTTDNLPADSPKTDRELLLQVHQDVKQLKEFLKGNDGNGGMCALVVQHGKELNDLKNWRWYIIGIGSVAVFAITIIVNKL